MSSGKKEHMGVVPDHRSPVQTGHKNLLGRVKGLVSKQKRRYQEDDYDLDLSYITDRLIAMGFPAESYEKMYRNSMDDICVFFEDKHPNHYWIYNLCSERAYNEERFHNRVIRFGFDDHNCPIFESMQQLCEHLDEWLSREKGNVAAMHCKAGKGRTGLMICTYLIHSGFYYQTDNNAQNLQSVVDSVLSYYAMYRTKNQKGVTIPSQRRWVSYYAQHMQRKINGTLHNHVSKAYRIKSFFISKDAPTWHEILIYNDKEKYLNYNPEELVTARKAMVNIEYTESTTITSSEGWKNEKATRIDKNGKKKKGTLVTCPDNLLVYKDVKCQFEVKGKLYGRSRAFSFWFHTDFIGDEPMRLYKTELDKVNKEKKTKDFFIEVEFEAAEDEENHPQPHENIRRLFSNANIGEHFAKDDLAKKLSSGHIEEITDDELVILGILLQGNIEIQNRVWKNNAYLDTFVAAEAAVLFRSMGLQTDQEIIQMGTRMLENEFFELVDMEGYGDSSENVFSNSYQFYRFL